MKVGIDLLNFQTSQYFLDLATLAQVRGADADKYRAGLGQERMSVPPPDEDVVTFAASAALPLLDKINPADIELLLFGTESGVDQSKAAAMFVHGLLGLNKRCRAVEIKEACYAATAGLHLALAWVQQHPTKKALVIGADIARYDLGSPGEPTQGCGADRNTRQRRAAFAGHRSRNRLPRRERDGLLAAELPHRGAGGR
ncbi:MAG: hypothetical protein NTY53_12115 [Kiritimatiellaeota bacterium]|nr:hypothetical protein [Kiritimatiellota bacterium]